MAPSSAVDRGALPGRPGEVLRAGPCQGHSGMPWDGGGGLAGQGVVGTC